MKALENRAIFAGFGHDHEKQIDAHHERLKKMRNVIDTSKPQSLSARCHSPSKRLMTKQAVRERIVKDNLLLAEKIFNIMEGTSDITEHVNDTRHIDRHPGTMNFKQRLYEAQRIHERNMLLASRLDTVKPYYKMTDLRFQLPKKKFLPIKKHKKNNKKSKFTSELNSVLKGERGITNIGEMTHRSTGNADVLPSLNFSKLTTESSHIQSQSARKADQQPQNSSSNNNNEKRNNTPGTGSCSGNIETDSRTTAESQRGRPSNVLLEYTKIQDGRVLDVAVLKEPFRDRYAIFGIDVDDGQRYELRLTSDEVSSILDGDMLVTSVDNVEVWMALLNKVILQKVQVFSKLPFTTEEVDSYNNTNNNSSSNIGSNNITPIASPNTRSNQHTANLFKHEVNHSTGINNTEGEFGENVSVQYSLQVRNTKPTSSEVVSSDHTRLPSAPTGQRPTASRVNTTSAIGSTRNRQLRSSGAGAGYSTERVSSSGVRTEKPVVDDSILSLFADANAGQEGALAVDAAGFLEFATSAEVTLVEANADFPDAPSDEYCTTERDTSVAIDKTPIVSETKNTNTSLKAATTKKAVPVKPQVGPKSGGNTRATMLRAAEVRRRSIESSQQTQTRAATVSSTGTKKKPETNLSPASIETSENLAVRPKSRLYTPKAPAAADTQSNASNSTNTTAPRPKSRVYTPKISSDNTAATGSGRPKSGAALNAPLTPRAPTSAKRGGSPRTAEKLSSNTTQQVQSPVKVAVEIPTVVVSSTEGGNVVIDAIDNGTVENAAVTTEQHTLETAAVTTEQHTLETAAATTEQHTLETTAVTTEQHTLETAAVTTESIQEDIQNISVNIDNNTEESKQIEPVETEENAVVSIVEKDADMSVVLKEGSLGTVKTDKDGTAEYSMDFEGSSQIVQ